MRRYLSDIATTTALSRVLLSQSNAMADSRDADAAICYHSCFNDLCVSKLHFPICLLLKLCPCDVQRQRWTALSKHLRQRALLGQCVLRPVSYTLTLP